MNARTWKLKNLPTRVRGWKAEVFNALGLGVCVNLSAVHISASGVRTDLGIVSRRVVTNNGVGYLVDALQNLTEPENLNWHDCGTGTNAEAAGDSALQTAYGGARSSGTQTEPASNQYRTTATISFSGTFAITEHGLFSANAAGTLFDRSVFTAINVVSGDSIQFQYTLTINSGG